MRDYGRIADQIIDLLEKEFNFTLDEMITLNSIMGDRLELMAKEREQKGSSHD